MDRKSKVDFLKRLFKGETSLEEIREKHFVIQIGASETTFQINGKEVSEEIYLKNHREALKKNRHMEFKVSFYGSDEDD